MVVNNVLWSIVLFFIQPVFLVGLIYAIVNYRRRVAYTRETYRVNFLRENVELKDYVLKGLVPGILLSILSVLIGIPLTIEWYITYSLITILLLLVSGYRLIHPLFTFTLTSLILYGLDWFQINLPFNQLNDFIQQETIAFSLDTIDFSSLTTNVLLFVGLILFLSTYQLDKQDVHKIFPILRSSHRGKIVAKYQRKSMWVLPLMVVVPGEAFGAFADWWPLLEINGNQYAFLLMPVLVGFHFTVSTQLVEEATERVQKEFRIISLVAIIGFIAAYFLPAASPWIALLLFVLGLVVLIRHRRRENQWSFRYGPTNEGIRVIAVRPDSPAERMDLKIGDTILDINDTEMMDMETYNQVLAYNRSYIKMRVRRTDGEIVITETPLYDNDYNNLGLLILEN